MTGGVRNPVRDDRCKRENFSASQRASAITPQLLTILEQRENFDVFELGAAIQEFEFDYHGNADNIAAELACQACARLCGASGGEEIVDNQNALALPNRVAV